MPKQLDVERFRVEPGTRVKLKDHDPAWSGLDDLSKPDKDQMKEKAQAILRKNLEGLAVAQELLWAADTYALLIILQAMDAAGKDGLIKHVMSGVNPMGCHVVSFKAPSAEELDHDFLWRCAKQLPERGRIGIFNRSYYEEVLVVRVHPEYLDRQKLPPGKREDAFWEKRFEDINTFERHLVRSGTMILKFFLHVSKEEQKKRFLERLDNPEKHWKFSETDVAERTHWKKYMRAYEEMLSATSTKRAPWYILPADHKWVTRILASSIITNAIKSLSLEYPRTTAERRRSLEAARVKLEAEDKRR